VTGLPLRVDAVIRAALLVLARKKILFLVDEMNARAVVRDHRVAATLALGLAVAADVGRRHSHAQRRRAAQRGQRILHILQRRSVRRRRCEEKQNGKKRE
jgi:hypothetical protein